MRTHDHLPATAREETPARPARRAAPVREERTPLSERERAQRERGATTAGRPEGRGPASREERTQRPALPGQAAGNRAVTALVRGSGPVVQRHSSWEHALMGDSRPGELASATGRIAPAQRAHVLGQELRRAAYFRDNPWEVPNTGAGGLFEGLRVLRLSGSGLFVTYGEVNALADYLPNGGEINAMTSAQILPILQYMRQEIANACIQARGSNTVDGQQLPDDGWSRAQEPGVGARIAGVFSDAGAAVLIEDAATRSRGFQSYKGLLSRNACHFAPMSWERYSQNHTLALQSAQQAHAMRSAAGGVPTAVGDAETQAWVHSGYADHFLEDSFAAGHLINKTLIMQWFMEYARSRHPLPTRIQMPDETMVRAMGSGSQQHVAGQDIYQVMSQGEDVYRGRAAGVQAPAVLPTDPQTASEMRGGGIGPEDRAALAGVQPVPGMTDRQVAHQYQLFLSNSFLQAAAGQVHDHFNAMTTGGLTVENGKGMRFRVGGDDTQLALSDTTGAQVVIDAVNLSRRSVEETITSGQSSVSGLEILMHVPTKVVLGARAVDLQTWNETVVRAYCDQLFPEVYDSVSAGLVRRLGPLPSTPNPDLAATR